MKIIATNIGNATTVSWRGNSIKTGIFKKPVATGITLQKEDVVNDTVIDRENHGGINKACYMFSSDNYAYWKEKYPNLDWDWGMFGENLTVEGLDETKIRIGNIYKIGEATVQVTQPREPCYKLGLRFNNQQIIKQFVEHEKPGTYVKIIEKGKVTAGDKMILIEEATNLLTVKQCYQLLYMPIKDKELVKLAITNKGLPQYKRVFLEKFI